MVRPGLDEHRTGIHPVCQQFYDAYLATHHEPPGRNQMAKQVSEAGVSRERAHRDWHSLRHTTTTQETSEMDDLSAIPTTPTPALESLAAQLAQLRQDRARDTAVIMSLLRSVETLEHQAKSLEAQIAADHEAAEHWRAFLQLLRTDAPTWTQLESLLAMRGHGKHSALTHWLRTLAGKPPLDPWC